MNFLYIQTYEKKSGGQSQFLFTQVKELIFETPLLISNIL